MSRLLTCTAALLALPSTLLAHPGHGSTDSATIEHYAVEPVHWLPLAGLIVGFVAATFVIRYWKRSR